MQLITDSIVTPCALTLGAQQAVLSITGNDRVATVAAYGWLFRAAAAKAQPHSSDVLVCLKALSLVRVKYMLMTNISNAQAEPGPSVGFLLFLLCLCGL